MIEIAICMAIISFALIAIIGVLPLGMNTQRDNREETVINQDATVLLETIRSGSRGADSLTNSVYAITNQWTTFSPPAAPVSGVDSFSYSAASFNGTPNSYYRLTNGANIIGILSTPEFTVGGRPFSGPFNGSFTSNHIVAYVRSISGLAAEQPPQNNAIMVGDSFAYRVYCVNAPMAVDTNLFNLPVAQRVFATQLAANLRELRLTFLWPQLPNGNVGNGRQTFRATVAGQLAQDPLNQPHYFYQSQSFTNAP